ncbi:hypothetical protein KHQ06_16060 [Nocardia tengchongensis]|uniref:Transposase n=1 Tax=Nocardia tengchongensis TaxID=2055889 RepID=A0ABX8CXT2_9NOCA|nr:hypothetical protein [Nocardia tengchongensis]QVI24151.1 hypothetical protein KHQ06_16060 [Nocardia tengchongensis]
MAKARKPMSRRMELRLGREIQEQYDRGASWTAITVDFDLPKYKVQRLAEPTGKTAIGEPTGTS